MVGLGEIHGQLMCRGMIPSSEVVDLVSIVVGWYCAYSYSISSMLYLEELDSK